MASSRLSSLALWLSALAMPTTFLAADAVSKHQCLTGNGDGNGNAPTVSVAASASVFPLLRQWSQLYTERLCSDGSQRPSDIVIELEDTGGSNRAASMLCGTSSSSVADVAAMTRAWDPNDAVNRNDWPHDFLYDCQRSTRNVLQIEIAMEGIALAYHPANTIHQCLHRHLGGALDKEQIRWIFSGWNEREIQQDTLAANGSGSQDRFPPYVDNDPFTKFWSELHPECPRLPIQLAGPALDDTKTSLFRSVFLPGFDEDIDVGRYTVLSETADYEHHLETHDGTVTFLGIQTAFTDLGQLTLISHATSFSETTRPRVVSPSVNTFHDGSFPYSRKLYISIEYDPSRFGFDGDQPEALSNKERQIRAFLDFGLTSPEAQNAVRQKGFWPLSQEEVLIMTTRLQSPSGVPLDSILEYCQRDRTSDTPEIAMAGSSTVFPVARIWSEIYRIGCPHISVSVDGGGSSAGAARVCSADPRSKEYDASAAVDIGDMSRNWKLGKEAALHDSDDKVYRCIVGDPERYAVQMDVAVDGLTVAVREGGVAWDCIHNVLGGLTVDQLRWIYSDYTDAQLRGAGWDEKSAIPNSDRNSATHTWSELHPDCALIEIRIAGADDRSGTYEQFEKKVLLDSKQGETFGVDRPVFGYFNSAEDEELVEYLQEHDEAVAYFGYSYYYANRNILTAVPIKNDGGDFVEPTEATIGDGSYDPLSRRIYMNLHVDEESLASTEPFVLFGLNHPELVRATGYMTVPSEEVDVLTDRLRSALENLHGDDEEELSRMLLVLVAVFGSALACVCCIAAVCLARRRQLRRQRDGHKPSTGKDDSGDTSEENEPVSDNA